MCLYPTREILRFYFRAAISIEVGKYRVYVLVGKGDLRHFLVLRNLAFGELCLQFSWIKPAVDITHRWRSLERTLANGFDGVAASAFLLKTPCLVFLPSSIRRPPMLEPNTEAVRR